MGRGGGCTRIGRTLVWGGPKAATVPASLLSFLLFLPLFLGRFVPGGASRLTVQYEPKPGSVTGRGCLSKRRFSDRWCRTDCCAHGTRNEEQDHKNERSAEGEDERGDKRASQHCALYCGARTLGSDYAYGGDNKKTYLPSLSRRAVVWILLLHHGVDLADSHPLLRAA